MQVRPWLRPPACTVHSNTCIAYTRYASVGNASLRGGLQILALTLLIENPKPNSKLCVGRFL